VDQFLGEVWAAATWAAALLIRATGDVARLLERVAGTLR
jgi:hypothetical protein